MKYLKRILGIFVAILVLIAVFPVSAFAVDPVSAATMANAFAQAVTAYGASHGVSMMFDVSNTSGIGEQVHELWKRFRSDQQTADDYASIASAVWPGLYSKIQRVAGAVVGINLAAEFVADLDGFWNWLLSGPAEMTKVDNQYYEWTVVDGAVSPIPVISTIDSSINGYSLVPLPVHRESEDGSLSNTFTASVNTVYCLPLFNSGNNYKYMVMVNLVNQNFQYYTNAGSSGSWASPNSGWYYVSIAASSDMFFDYGGTYYPTINSSTTPNTYFGTYNSDNIVISESGISVQPYIGDTAPQDVYIPDNEDVNYAPLPVSIPLDIPWDDSLYGDGQVVSDQDSIAIAGSSDLVISDTGTLTLAEPIEAPVDPPNEVYIPLLPVQLPNFNFSFSGIWHYVVSWVQSLGSWFSLMFQTWAALPYAITLPVYATAVVVIIIGTLKRFL